MLLPVKYRFPDGYDVGRLIGELAERYTVRTGRSTSDILSMHDTFDWRLYHRSLVLVTAGTRLFLRRLFETAPLHAAEINAPPVTIRDIPEGDLRKTLSPILGVRALRGTETKDGFEFDFHHDRLMLDTRTPIGKYQGGGFGPTVQLNDGTLVTSYSYRGEDDKTHVEVVRWKL